MDRKEMKRTLVLSYGGTPKELAKLCGVTPSDSTFRRALAEVVEARALFPQGNTQDRHYITRAEAFGIMGTRAAKKTEGRPIGATPKKQT